MLPINRKEGLENQFLVNLVIYGLLTLGGGKTLEELLPAAVALC